MPYTTDRQKLKTGIDKTIEGILLLREAVLDVIVDTDPRTLDNMVTLCDDLTRLEAKLRKL